MGPQHSGRGQRRNGDFQQPLHTCGRKQYTQALAAHQVQNQWSHSSHRLACKSAHVWHHSSSEPQHPHSSVAVQAWHALHHCALSFASGVEGALSTRDEAVEARPNASINSSTTRMRNWPRTGTRQLGHEFANFSQTATHEVQNACPHGLSAIVRRNGPQQIGQRASRGSSFSTAPPSAPLQASATASVDSIRSVGSAPPEAAASLRAVRLLALRAGLLLRPVRCGRSSCRFPCPRPLHGRSRRGGVRAGWAP